MINKLRRRFVFVAMISVVVVLTVIIGFINAANYHKLNDRSDKILSILADNGGHFPAVFPIPPNDKSGISLETPFTTRFFSVTLDGDKNVEEVDLTHVAGMTVEKSCQYAISLAKEDKLSGFEGDYKYLAVENNGLTTYVFLDCSQSLFAIRNLLKMSLMIFFYSLILIFILVVILSKIVLRPVEQSYVRQKSFITNASHDIKTPLAVIGAQADVIEIESGESSSVKEIKNQVAKLNQLTEKLVFLSKMEEEAYKAEFKNFELSAVVEEICYSYVNLAKAKGVSLNTKIADTLNVRGDQDMLGRALALVLDNAVKYVKEGGTINVCCSIVGKYCQIVCENDCENIEEGNHDELFERFYRLEKSRNEKTGGHGIGLSVVKAIVETHKGKILASSLDGKSMRITITLPKSDK